MSSPYVRCVQTVQPLAEACRLPIEEEPGLVEGKAAKAIRLVRDLLEMDDPDGVPVLCTHGDIVPEVLREVVERDGVDLGFDVRCGKGSTWVLDAKAGKV